MGNITVRHAISRPNVLKQMKPSNAQTRNALRTAKTHQLCKRTKSVIFLAQHRGQSIHDHEINITRNAAKQATVYLTTATRTLYFVVIVRINMFYTFESQR